MHKSVGHSNLGNLSSMMHTRWFVWAIGFGLLALSLAMIPAAHAVLAEATAVGDNAVRLSGDRPAEEEEDFDLSGYIEVPHSPDLNPSGGALTIEAWVKRNSTTRHETLVGNGWQDSYWLGFSPTGKLRFFPHGADSGVDGNSSVAGGVWTHVAVSYDGTTRNYYINGVLDKSSTQKPGALVPAAAGQFLGIGFDREDNFLPNYFGGQIDNLRIWNVVRNGDEIHDSMFDSFGEATPGLLAEWAFNGNLTDTAGGHNAASEGSVEFGNEGAIPHDIRIPQASVTPTLNGQCNSASEYATATKVTVDGAEVWLLHTATDLWICFDYLGSDNNSATVYLDADYTRTDPAQHEHLALSVNESDTKSALTGESSGTYVATNAFDGQWDADYSICCGEFPTNSAEFRIDAQVVKGWDHVMGLALRKSSPSRGDQQIWPALAVYNLPSSWSSAILGGVGAPRTFSGKVVYEARDSAAEPDGIPGVVVKLIGSDPGGSEAIVAVDTSSLNGSFSLQTTDDYANHRLEAGAPPKGYLTEEATAPAPAAIIDARTIDYGAAAAGDYADNLYLLSDALPGMADNQNGPYFLIVAPDAIIDSGALDEFAAFKRRLGFSVELKSVEEVDAEFSGDNRLVKIRALEQARLTSIGSRFQYVLLIGTDAEIPFARLVFWFGGYVGGDEPEVDLTGCLQPEDNGLKIKYSDWVYADLTSNFDSNGNGCISDGTAVDTSVTPYAPGYTPDSAPLWEKAVAVGRLNTVNESVVRTALKNSMGFEMQAEAFKRRTVLAMSQPFMKGQFWTPKDSPTGQYMPCVGAGQSDKNCKGGTADAAYLGERMRDDFLNGAGYNSTIFYESAKPEGASLVQSPLPLNVENVRTELEARPHGFVNLAGHGSGNGVYRTYWNNQNGNSTLDSPTAPNPTMSVDEAEQAELLTKDTLNLLTPDNSRGAVYFAASCSTGSALSATNFGMTLLKNGNGVAWIGALNMINVGGWTQPGSDQVLSTNYWIVERMLSDNLRLGDAVWQSLEFQQEGQNTGSAGVSHTLYGDPTLSFWGNPGGQSTLAAWPMARYDGRGVGYSPLAGPEIPVRMWEYEANTPQPTDFPPSPVVSNNGEVIVAHGSFVDVLRQGQLHQRLTLDAAAYGSPALASDGTVYATDVNGNLYAFPYQSYLYYPIPMLYGTIEISDNAEASAASIAEVTAGNRQRRWKLDLGGAARTTPIISSDGFIAVGIPGKVLAVRPDGVIFRQRTVEGNPIGALATDTQRNIYVTTDAGYFATINFFCHGFDNGCLTASSHIPTEPYSTPPLFAYGSIYAGRENGKVGKPLSPANFQADSAITAGPVIGPGGQILVGTQNGTLYSLTKDLGLRWQRNLGATVKSIPAFSSDALYVVSNNSLRAYNPFSGAPLWSRGLGSGTGSGSVAVGYGRELYAQTTGGAVFGYNEGWTNQPIAVSASQVEASPGNLGIAIEWQLALPPVGAMAAVSVVDTGSDSVPESVPDSVDESMPEAASGVSGLLLQRRANDEPWTDLVVLPPGTTLYTDTSVAPDVEYAYRVKVLESAGNDSDYTTTLLTVLSLPSLPQVPVLESATAMAADSVLLQWALPVDDVVSDYRIERSQDGGGPFTPVSETLGSVVNFVDSGLLPATGYFYRIVAINATGESAGSNVVNVTTRQQTLAAPQNVTAQLLADGSVEIRWMGGPEGVTTVIEATETFLNEYGQLAVAGPAGPYRYYPGEPSTYLYRLKFVQGDNESVWVETPVVVLAGAQVQIYLPVTKR